MQCIKLDGILSHPLPVVSGVPQGSILGPLLFLIFINNIPETVTSPLFADDTKCFKTIGNHSHCHSLQQDLQQRSDWSHLWNLHFNEKKCVCIHFSTKGPITYQYCINKVPVSVQIEHRDLGIIMSSDLSWDEHYKCLLARAYNSLNVIRRVFRALHCLLNKKIQYLSLVRSKLMYACPVWRPNLIT